MANRANASEPSERNVSWRGIFGGSIYGGLICVRIAVSESEIAAEKCCERIRLKRLGFCLVLNVFHCDQLRAVSKDRLGKMAWGDRFDVDVGGCRDGAADAVGVVRGNGDCEAISCNRNISHSDREV